MMKFDGLGPRALLAAAAAGVVLAGCGGGGESLPLIRATIDVKTVSQGGICEVVPVRIVPVELRGEANKYANRRTMVLDIEMTGPTDENGAPMCNGSGETLPIAPGDWEFSAPLASGSYSCKRDIQADGNLRIIFTDGVEGCDGAPPAPVEPYPVEGGDTAGDDAAAGAEAPAEG